MRIENSYGDFSTDDVLNCNDITQLNKWLHDAKMSALHAKLSRIKIVVQRNELEKKINDCDMAETLQQMLAETIENKITNLNQQPLPSSVIDEEEYEIEQ